MNRKERIEDILSRAFEPSFLEISDDSARHAKHMPHAGGAGHDGETHYRVTIVSPSFAGRTRLDRHRAVNAALADEFGTGLHALAIDAREA